MPARGCGSYSSSRIATIAVEEQDSTRSYSSTDNRLLGATMNKRLSLTLALCACVLALAVYAATRPKCECFYLGHGNADPADCPVHGSVTP